MKYLKENIAFMDKIFNETSEQPRTETIKLIEKALTCDYEK